MGEYYSFKSTPKERLIIYESYATYLELSTIGRAISPKSDMSSMIERHQLIVPEEPWEEYGCEDPRVTKIDDTFYIFYTALSDYPYKAENIKVALAISKDLQTINSMATIAQIKRNSMGIQIWILRILIQSQIQIIITNLEHMGPIRWFSTQD